jgi:hypothetical protein
MSATPPGWPGSIPIQQETFQNWAGDITVFNVWTCVPSSASDVVTVCNWAAGAGYQVRPRGIMHNWSPLTLVEGQPPTNVVLVDTTKSLTKITVTPASGSTPPQVYAQTGATMLSLMTAMENAAGGQGKASGYSFAHIPAPGNLTVGGALAINAHGTAVPTPPNDNFRIPYGSLSNLIVAFTAVVSDPATGKYVSKTFSRGDADAKAFLTHCGRAFLLDVTLQAIDNYNLRCQSIMNIAAATMFAPPPTPDGPPPANSAGAFLNQSGRIEAIWFPPLPLTAGGPVPTTYPWLKVWTVAPSQPSGSTLVTAPYNYPFSDNIPKWLSDLLKFIVSGNPGLTPTFTAGIAEFTKAALYGGQLTDLWGASKNTLLYVQDTTLTVTANGYAVLMKRNQVQQAIADFATVFVNMLVEFQNRGLYPINSPCEIRVTGLDDPSLIATQGGSAQSPVISSVGVDPVVKQAGWDVAVWFDVLTAIIDNSQKTFEYYEQMEAWFERRFPSPAYRYMPEWSKGWAYTATGGAWTNQQFIRNTKTTLTTGRPADANWSWEVQTLAKYDAAKLFFNPFLTSLFTV